MFDSLDILQTEVDSALGHPDRKLLDPEDVTASAIEVLEFYGLEAQQSQYGRVSKMVEFSPTMRDHPVNKASGMIVPLWVERRVGNLINQQWERWERIHTVHSSMLGEIATRRCSWERRSDGLHLIFNYDPVGTGPYRLHYYADPDIANALNDPLGLPTRYGFLFLHETILLVISRMLQRAAQLPEAEHLNSAQLNALSAQMAHSEAQAIRWKAKWDTEQNAEKAPKGRNRRPVLGRMGRG